MKLYVNRVLIDHAGKPVLDGPAPNNLWPLTLGVLSVEALLRKLPGDDGAPGNTKIMRWKLAQKLEKDLTRFADKAAWDYGGEYLKAQHYIIVSTEEMNMIKERIMRGFDAAIVGPADVAIEQEGPEDLDVRAGKGGKGKGVLAEAPRTAPGN